MLKTVQFGVRGTIGDIKLQKSAYIIPTLPLHSQ